MPFGLSQEEYQDCLLELALEGSLEKHMGQTHCYTRGGPGRCSDLLQVTQRGGSECADTLPTAWGTAVQISTLGWRPGTGGVGVE